MSAIQQLRFWGGNGETDSQATMLEAAAEIDHLHALLRDARCPGGGWSGMPDDIDPTVDACLKAGVCGCVFGAPFASGERHG